MATETKDIGLPPEMEADTQAVIEHMTTGKPLNPDVAKRIRERGQRLREAVFQKHGVLDIGVPAIRELRDGE